jgi:hypothetical protein
MSFESGDRRGRHGCAGRRRQPVSSPVSIVAMQKSKPAELMP